MTRQGGQRVNLLLHSCLCNFNSAKYAKDYLWHTKPGKCTVLCLLHKKLGRFDCVIYEVVSVAQKDVKI